MVTIRNVVSKQPLLTIEGSKEVMTELIRNNGWEGKYEVVEV